LDLTGELKGAGMSLEEGMARSHWEDCVELHAFALTSSLGPTRSVRLWPPVRSPVRVGLRSSLHTCFDGLVSCILDHKFAHLIV